MEAKTATGFSLEVEFNIWGHSAWGPNECSAHIAEGYGFELLGKTMWDWKPREGTVTTIDGQMVPEWWRLPYVVREYEQEITHA